MSSRAIRPQAHPLRWRILRTTPLVLIATAVIAVTTVGAVAAMNGAESDASPHLPTVPLVSEQPGFTNAVEMTRTGSTIAPTATPTQTSEDTASQRVQWPLHDRDAHLTDGFGPREAPVPGASTNHRGQDFAGQLGTTGASTGPHLHLEILVAEVHVDPLAFLRHYADGEDVQITTLPEIDWDDSSEANDPNNGADNGWTPDNLDGSTPEPNPSASPDPSSTSDRGGTAAPTETPEPGGTDTPEQPGETVPTEVDPPIPPTESEDTTPLEPSEPSA